MPDGVASHRVDHQPCRVLLRVRGPELHRSVHDLLQDRAVVVDAHEVATLEQVGLGEGRRHAAGQAVEREVDVVDVRDRPGSPTRPRRGLAGEQLIERQCQFVERAVRAVARRTPPRDPSRSATSTVKSGMLTISVLAVPPESAMIALASRSPASRSTWRRHTASQTRQGTARQHRSSSSSGYLRHSPGRAGPGSAPATCR